MIVLRAVRRRPRPRVAGLAAGDLDLIVYGSCSNDEQVPNSASGVQAGIGAVMNFAPVQLHVPEHIALKNVNMAVELEGLSYALASERTNGRTRD